MKLYYSPGTCALAPHIILNEAGLDYTLVQVDLKSHKTFDDIDYYTINSKGQVPLLELNNGALLSEGPIIAQYIADLVPQRNLIPKFGSMERYRVAEWQNFITSELHKSFTPLFNADLDGAAKDILKKLLRKKFEWVNEKLEGKQYLENDTFTIADAYLFVVSRWSKSIILDITDLNNLQQYLTLISKRPAVSKAMQEEGL